MLTQIGLALGAVFVYIVLRTWMTWAWKRLAAGEKVVPMVSDKHPMTKEP